MSTHDIQLDWGLLLSDTRHAADGTPTSSQTQLAGIGERSAFEADYDRVVFSTPFRRLARKTQVHPIALNDHIHNRLTHSMEVASVGRSFGKRLCAHLAKMGESDRRIDSIPTILQAACLAHDIGNPPFGHAGEHAIREWFNEHSGIFCDLDEETKTDIRCFEGNAQGFRFASRADNSFCGYMHLTSATLSAMVKYPWDARDPRAREKPDKVKYNYFASERSIFDAMCAQVGTKKSENSYVRHPLSFLMEAADDICYTLLDMEDGVAMGLLEERAISEQFSLLAGVSGSFPLSQLRSKAIGVLIERVWSVFEGDYQNIMTGCRTADLKSGLPVDIAAALKAISANYNSLFLEARKMEFELGAYKVLGKITHSLYMSVQALAKIRSIDRVPFISKRCIEFAWGAKYVKENETMDLGWWARQVLDYVAGLTDVYAIKTARAIEGDL